jgi:hypothetical protein
MVWYTSAIQEESVYNIGPNHFNVVKLTIKFWEIHDPVPAVLNYFPKPLTLPQKVRLICHPSSSATYSRWELFMRNLGELCAILFASHILCVSIIHSVALEYFCHRRSNLQTVHKDYSI